MNLNKKPFWILFFLPVSITTYLAYLFFINLPLVDYWDTLYSGLHVAGDSLDELLKYAWEPVVDQRMVFSKLFIYFFSSKTQNNHYGLEIIFGLVGQIVVLLLMSHLLWKTPNMEKGRKPLLLLTFSWLLFWPNIAVRFQHHWYSTQYTFVLVFALLSISACVQFREMWAGVLLSLFFGICSAISHGTGLIYLLCYTIAFIAVSGWTKSQKTVVAVIGFSITAFIASQIPPRDTLNMPPLNWFMEKPFQELIFIFRCFGPDGVLQAQTGFVTLALGLFSCWKLLRRKKLFEGDYFGWLLIFFWGGSVAVISGVTRSAASTSPFRVYFYFFVIVLTAVIVLCAIVWPPGSFARKSWKFAGFVLVVLYLVGCADGIHDAAKIFRRNVTVREKLQFQPLLIDSDYHDLFPFPRIKSIVTHLHEQGLLGVVDMRPFTQKADIHFTHHMKAAELCFIPDRELVSGEVIAFPVANYKEISAQCFWKSGEDWDNEHSQDLQLRPVANNYWVLFISGKLPGERKTISAVKLHFLNDLTEKQIAGLPAPTVWARE